MLYEELLLEAFSSIISIQWYLKMFIAKAAVNYTNVICIGNRNRRNVHKKRNTTLPLRVAYVEETIRMYVCIVLALV